jgi:hypothetical protein
MLTDQDLVKFRKLVEEYSKRNTVTKQAAIDCLIREGIFNKDGQLAEIYGGPKGKCDKLQGGENV